MASRSNLSYAARGSAHRHPVVKRLFQVAESKRSNLVIPADMTDTESQLQCTNGTAKSTMDMSSLGNTDWSPTELGPYIAVFKTHVDIVRDFGEKNIQGLKALAQMHNFLIFEDRKIVDIGSTAQKQYHGGALRMSEWADFVNISILGGEGAVEAFEQVLLDDGFAFRGERALLMLAEMTTAGSLATGEYTRCCVEVARRRKASVAGFVAMRSLRDVMGEEVGEDFVVFTTGVNSTEAGDALGQQYQTPMAAVKGGSDFIIAGRGIYVADDRVEAAKRCQAEGWAAYEAHIQ